MSTSLFRPAVKEKLKARVALDGPTGSGKTYTALLWARILAGDGPVGVIDTENRSAAYYAPAPGTAVSRLQAWDAPYDFGHMVWAPPYDPERLARTIEAAAGELGESGVLVIDSLTHFWTGEGGTLDVVDNASARSGNSFSGWKVGTPVQRNLIDTIVHAPFHVIVTMRSKMEWVVEQVVKDGKTINVPRKIGLAPEQRGGIEYEFTLVADMDLDHRLAITKSRCNVVADVVAMPGRAHEPAMAFRDWLDSGVERVGPGAAGSLVERMNAVEDATARKALKSMFAETWGQPAELLTDALQQAEDWLAERLALLAPPVAPIEPPAPAKAPVAADQPARPNDVKLIVDLLVTLGSVNDIDRDTVVSSIVEGATVATLTTAQAVAVIARLRTKGEGLIIDDDGAMRWGTP